MAIQDDFSVASNGDIRHVSGTTVYSVNAFHAWLQDLADDSAPAGNDLISILSDDPSSIEGGRATDKPRALNLLGSFNIDDDAAKYINFGSVAQASGATLYTGLKSIGTPLVAGSPVYVVQNGAKLTTYWPNGHIQVMVKAKTGGSLIDNGDVRVFSRKYGQTYADFLTNLAAGGEQPAAISTALTDWTTLNEAGAAALSAKVTITPGDVTKTLGANTKLFKGQIILSGGCTVAEAAQYLQYVCREASTTTINGADGWRYRALDASYDPNAAAPFGAVAGGKWFVAQGWWLEGVLAGDSQNYQLTSHDGTVMTAPIAATIEIGNLTAGDRVLAGRDNGSGGFLTNEYTLNGATTAGGNTCVVNEAIKADTPPVGYIRVNGVPYSYTGYNAGTKTFTISGTWGQIHANASPAWVPFLDLVADASTESNTYTSAGNFTGRVKVRRGGASPIKPFETTFAVGPTGGGTNLIRTLD
jgi:hypothetical protein